jgi:hypothetical protein
MAIEADNNFEKIEFRLRVVSMILVILGSLGTFLILAFLITNKVGNGEVNITLLPGENNFASQLTASEAITFLPLLLVSLITQAYYFFKLKRFYQYKSRLFHILVGIFSWIIFLILFTLWLIQTNPSLRATVIQKTTQNDNSTATLISYSDSKYGFDFKYPSTFTTQKVGGDITLILSQKHNEQQVDELKIFLEKSPIVKSVNIEKTNYATYVEIETRDVFNINSYDPDEMFGAGFIKNFSTTPNYVVQNFAYHGPLLDFFDSNKQLVLEVSVIPQDNTTQDQYKFQGGIKPSKTLNNIDWAMSAGVTPETEFSTQNNVYNDIYIEGVGKKSFSNLQNFHPNIIIKNKDNVGLCCNRSDLKFYPSKEGFSLAYQIMNTFVFK